MIKQLQRRTDSVGSRQPAVGSRQFEAPTQEEAQSRTRSVGTVGYQSAVGPDSPTGESRILTPPRAERDSHHSADGQQATRQATSGQTTGQAAGQKASGSKGKGGVFKGLISGTLISESLILKDIRYTALIAVLAIIFIANKFNAEKMERQIIVLEQEVRDMRAESLSVSAELGSVSRQSEITELVKERGLGLEELREPPYRIVVNE